MDRFQGQTVVVTGGSSGIGRAIAVAFADEGAWVLAVGRDEAGLQGTRDAAAHPELLHSHVADLTTPGAPQRAVREAIERTGDLHVLVNGAGIALEDGFLEMREETWRSTMAINVDAAIWASQEAARHMAEHGGGVIVNITSVDAFSVESPQVHYNASKAALQMATRSMAHELAHRGVRVNAVAPGQTLTPMVEGDVADADFSAAYLKKIPMGRYADPAEQAKAVLFLASKDAAYITGETLVVDGGETLGSWYDPREA